jgi:hypothetical protein
MVERAARAMWDAQRKQEVAALATLDADTSYILKAAELMKGSDARTQVMIGFSAVSKSLAIGMKAHLSHSSEKDRKEMLEGLGPLSSDAAKMRLARLMGWVPPLVSGGVQALRQARNLVAHDIVDTSEIPFPRNLPKDVEADLSARIVSMVDAANSGDEVNPKLIADDAHKVGRYALVLAFDTLDSIVWGPARLRLGIGAATGKLFKTEEAPEWATRSLLGMVGSVLLLSGASLEDLKSLERPANAE